MSKEKLQKPDLTSGKKIIYQTKKGSLELKTDAITETIWLTQVQVAELFDVKKAAISKRVKNILKRGACI